MRGLFLVLPIFVLAIAAGGCAAQNEQQAQESEAAAAKAQQAAEHAEQSAAQAQAAADKATELRARMIERIGSDGVSVGGDAVAIFATPA